MATINYFVSGKKRKLVPVYCRLSAGREIDLIVSSGLTVDPHTWSNTTQSIKQRIRTDADEKFVKNLSGLKEHIVNEIRNYSEEYSKEWLNNVIYKYHNKRAADATTLNEYIDQFIKDAKSGERKNKNAMNLTLGTIKTWKGFQRIFNEYQGVYSDERLKQRKENNKLIRPRKLVDFDNINIDFYNNFVKFLSDEGYVKGTIGRFIKELKMFMRKSLDDKLHNNRDFMHSAFRVFTSETFAVYLTRIELDKIYNIDLSNNHELDIARDAFMVLCETALRISDYRKVDVSIRKSEDGIKLIHLAQSKTGNVIVIPLSARLEAILQKYNNKLPRLLDQYINKRIKIVAKLCGINEVLTWETEKYGKKFEKKAHKWELISCHTGRRSAASNMYLSGIPSISIMQITGHRSEKSFLLYIRVSQEENARKLATHEYFRNGLKVI